MELVYNVFELQTDSSERIKIEQAGIMSRAGLSAI